MKRTYLNLLTIFALTSPALTMQAAIYVQNNYGAPIEYVETTPQMVNLQPTHYQLSKLGNGERSKTPVGRLSPYLSIRSIGGSYYDISYVFRDIHIHQVNHYGEDAIITIYPRQGLSGIYYWNVVIEWENPQRKILEFSKKTGDVKVQK